jgi:hypothetical protein
MQDSRTDQTRTRRASEGGRRSNGEHHAVDHQDLIAEVTAYAEKNRRLGIICALRASVVILNELRRD